MVNIKVFEKLFNQMNDGVLIITPQSEIIFSNKACTKMFGYSKDEFQTMKMIDLYSDDSTGESDRDFENILPFEELPFQEMVKAIVPCVDKVKKHFVSRISCSRFEDDDKIYAMVLIQEFTNYQDKLYALEVDTNVDRLTNLFNENYLKTVTEPDSRFLSKWPTIAVFSIDLDQFTLINESLGWETGDTVLRLVAKRLKESVRHDDIIFRIRGDQFMILLNLTEVHDKTRLLTKISSLLLNKISQPVHLQNRSFEIEVSIGAGIYPDDEAHFAKLVDLSIQAMKEAKKEASFMVYVADMI